MLPELKGWLWNIGVVETLHESPRIRTVGGVQSTGFQGNSKSIRLIKSLIIIVQNFPIRTTRREIILLILQVHRVVWFITVVGAEERLFVAEVTALEAWNFSAAKAGEGHLTMTVLNGIPQRSMKTEEPQKARGAGLLGGVYLGVPQEGMSWRMWPPKGQPVSFLPVCRKRTPAMTV